MNEKIFRRWAVIAVVALFMSLRPDVALQESPAPKALTVMVYMCGSDLETLNGSATADIEEMLQSSFDADQVNLVVMAGGSRRWDRDLRSGEACVIEFFKKRGELKSRVVRPKPDVNMGDPETFTGFIQESLLLYPAKEYALIIWDHGQGPLEGVCLDELNKPDRITLDGLAEGLDDAALPKKLSWVGFDACLMGTVEVANAVAPYAEYMIASQAEEPPTGWNYSFLKGIELDSSTVETGMRIVDAYFDANADSAGEINLSCIDLSAIPEIEDSMNAMFLDLSALLNAESFSRFSSLRTGATGFGRDKSASQMSGDYDLVDVASLCDCFDEIVPEGARRVRDAIAQGVRYSRAQPENCSGLSAYHPFRNRWQYVSGWKNRYEALNFCPGYTCYVKTYGNIMAGDQLVKWTGLDDITVTGFDVSEDGAASDASVVALRISSEQAANLASARLVVLARNIYDSADDAYFRVYSTADISINDTVITAAYDGCSMQIMDASAQNYLTGPVAYRVSEDGAYLLDVYPIEADGSRWEQPILAEYAMTPSGELALRSYSVYDEMLGAYSTRVQVDFNTIRGFAFLNECRVPAYSDAQERLSFDAWQSDLHTDVQQKTDSRIDRTDFRPTFGHPTITEDLYAAYELTDTQGNVYMSDLARLSGESVQYYGHESVLGFDMPNLEACFTSSWTEGYICWDLYVENISDVPQQYLMGDITINGVPMEGLWPVFFGGEEGLNVLPPGEMGCFTVWIDAEALDGLSNGDTLQQVTACMLVTPESGDDLPLKVMFSVSPMLATDVLYRSPGPGDSDQLLEDVPIRLLDSGKGEMTISTQVILRTAERSADCGIIVNVVLNNRTSDEVGFALLRVALNGVPVKAGVLNAEGSGEQGSLAPGERVSANIELNHAHISAIITDVSLRRLDFTVAEYHYSGGEKRLINSFPVTIDLDIPLACFHDDAAALPSQTLIDQGRMIGALDTQAAMTLFETEACDIALQGLYLVHRNAVLLLRCENRSDTAQNVFLGQAGFGGRAAALGNTVEFEVAAHNNQVHAFGQRLSQWLEETGVQINLAPGAVEYRYVSLAPASKDQREANDITLRAYMYPTGNPMNYSYFGEAIIRFAEPAPLADGFESIAPKEELTIIPGRLETAEQAKPLFEDDVRMPEGDLAQYARHLSLTLPEDMRLDKGFYVLLRQVRGYEDMSALNLFSRGRNSLLDSTMHTFGSGEGLLLYQAYGRLTPAIDGRSAMAHFPGLLPVVESCAEQLPLSVIYIDEGTDGSITFEQDSNSMGFVSTVFPNATLTTMAYNLALTVHPNGGRGELADCDFFDQDAEAALRGMVRQDAYLCPANADEQALKAFVQDKAGITLYQAQPMDGSSLRVALQPIENPEDYCVVFYYLTSDGVVRCTAPLPLSSFD